MIANIYRPLAVVLAALLPAAPALAQAPVLPRTSPFAGGVPSGTATAAPITLTIVQAVVRGLQHNLGVLLAEQNTSESGGARLIALSRLRPNLSLVERRLLSRRVFIDKGEKLCR